MSKSKSKIILFKSLKVLCVSAFLAALSIVFGKYLAINVGEVLRFSFENMPIMFASIAFGPLVGMAVGIVADLLGCVLVGFTVNPLVTLGAAAVGFFSGLTHRLLSKLTKCSHAVKITLSVTVAHTIGSLIIKTFGLAAYYSMPFFILLLWRLLNYVIIGALDGILLWYLFKNRLIQLQIKSILRK